MASLCVFCGSSFGKDPAFRLAAHELGTALAVAGHRLIYGGGDVGLMGVIADSALEAGGAVTGVITDHLVGAEVAHRRLSVLEVAGSMHERKARMADLSDGVIVLPGGFGTLDESFELLTWNQLGLVSMPIVFLDVAGYFGGLFAFVESAVGAGFVRDQHAGFVQRAATVAEAIILATAPPPTLILKWLP